MEIRSNQLSQVMVESKQHKLRQKSQVAKVGPAAAQPQVERGKGKGKGFTSFSISSNFSNER